MNKTQGLYFHFKIFLGLLAVGSTVYAASTDNTNARKPAPPPEATHPVPDRRTPSPPAPLPPSAPTRTVFRPPYRPEPINRDPVILIPAAPGSVILPTDRRPGKPLPPPRTITAASNQWGDQRFTEIAVVVFTNGARRGFATLNSTDGHRLQVDSYTVLWRLPKGQSGVIDFAPFFPDSPNRPSNQELGLYADPGEPLQINGSRTDGDSAGSAEIVFTGEETAVPREKKDPAGP